MFHYKKIIVLLIIIFSASILYVILFARSHKLYFLPMGLQEVLMCQIPMGTKVCLANPFSLPECGQAGIGIKHLEIFGPGKIGSGGDTIYHAVPDFEFLNQYGEKINRNNFSGKIYVTDFIFTTCKSICPRMSSQMKCLQEEFYNSDDVLLLSHTVNPGTDSVSVLFDYAMKIGAKKDKWHFLTGEKKEIYDLARYGYFVTAEKGDNGPEDFIHSEKFILIDKQGRIRGYYDGTDSKDIDRLIDEIKILKDVKEN